ncbi:DUF6798 domain-containing protein [Alienimonas californiensis]|uniref:DUF6798 domain-containing protein n=1 Tax=Alienimonas californiensis TaxID=2527989 RepID=A0A517P5X9_9PLAN|nr:DUF6798 domain-containing protein [Alienimonas californiensis]QDT14784.1 hypothetical protein CA12_08630 [Alienimonas californiensis]
MKGVVAGTLLFAALMAYSLVQSPVPGVNEPQYLGKALHLVDPSFCPGDFFLDSSDPHGVFGLLCGPVADGFGLPAAALFGRATGLALLACGWTLLATRVIGTPWAAPLSGAAFLAAAAVGNLSGEWLVGGAEGKVFSYGFLLLGLAWGLERRWLPAAAAAGAAVSFHPVVGVWGAACGAFAAAALAGARRWRGEPMERPAPRTAAAAAGLFLLCAVPGLWFALDALDAAPGANVGRANFLQVYLRLPHHLDPMTFRTHSWFGFFHLTAAWVLLRRWGARTAAETAFALVVLGSLLIAYVGVLIGLRTGEPHEAAFPYLRAFLLKFYPFRLADVLVPLAAALAFAGCAIRWATTPPRTLAATGAAGALFLLSVWTPFYDRDPSGLSPEDAAAWESMCGWIDETLPADAVVVTPTRNHAFKWFAQRAEYVCFKDCPQDPAGILEWNRRLRLVRDWARLRWGDDETPGFDRSELGELGVATEADYLLTATLEPIDAPPTHVAGPWRLYALRPEPPNAD